MQHVKTIAGVKIMPKNVAVKLGDGTIISLSDLPPQSTTRWVASNKAAVVKVFMAGLISKEDILERYELSDEEFECWLNRFVAGGKNALKIVNLRAVDYQARADLSQAN